MIGHRGDPSHHPDNTLTGIASALAAVGAVEVDVRISLDGRLVLSHEPEIGGYVIAESTWPRLAGLEASGGHRPCLLDEAMGIPGSFDLEIKNLPGEAHFDGWGRLALLVASRARSGDVVTSFYWPDIDLIRRHSPEVATGLLVGEEGSAIDALAHAVEEGHRVVAPHHTLIDAELSRAAIAAGVAVVAWTVNDLDRAWELSELGVAAIISDHPLSISSGLTEPTT